MGLLGGLIGGVGAATAGIVSGNANRRAARRNAKILENARKRSQSWYDQEYNADFLQRSDAQNAINSMRDILKDRYNASAAQAAVTGATDESLAQQKAAANKAVGDVTSNIAERADAYKDQVRANYENTLSDIESKQMGVNNSRAQATAQAAGGLASAANSLGTALDDTNIGYKFNSLF